ncbi:helix-turn-helix domain-containing protein [Escherichia coli]|nr:helix-turn-helix domain-containing protein [Escherichia coli]
MAKCIATHTMDYSWLLRMGMTANEMLVYCLINDFEYGCKVVYLTYKQIAEYLGSDDKSEAPYIARKAVKGLVEKGFIEIHYHGGRGSANHYRLLKTPYSLFHEMMEKDPEYFSEAQIKSLEKDLSRAKPAEKPAENREQPTPEVETTVTVDAHNWENRDEDIKKQARQLWESKYKTKAEQHKSVALHLLRDEIRGQEATDCKDVRPDKYWNIHKQDFNIIMWMIKKGLDVVIGKAPWRNVENAITEDGKVILKLVEDNEEVAAYA